LCQKEILDAWVNSKLGISKTYKAKTTQQVECPGCEVGVLIHYDIQVFHPEGYQFNDAPPATVFDPTQLDTDQWTQTAKPQALSTLSWFQAWERI